MTISSWLRRSGNRAPGQLTLTDITPDDRKCAHDVLQHYRRYHQVDQPQTVEEGIALYVADRRTRLKNLSADELANFFGVALSKKKSYTRIPPDYVTSKGKNFYVRLQASPWLSRSPIPIPWFSHRGTRLISGQPTELIGTPGLSGADVTPVSSDGQQVTLYFKRWGKKYSPAIIGKKMGAEVAAWRLSELLGIEIVPNTQLVRYRGEVGSGQKPVDANFQQGSYADAADIQNCLSNPSWADAMAELYTLDYLASNVDRSVANTFFDFAGHRIQAIDHDAAFSYILPCIPSSSEFISGGRLSRQYSARLQSGIGRLTYPQVKMALRDVLAKDEIEAVWLRVQILRVHMLQVGSETQVC